VIVRLEAEGALVTDADDCGRLHLETALADERLRVALRDTGTGRLGPDGEVWLDLAVLRSRGQLSATGPDWADRFAAMVAHAQRKGWTSPDGRAVRAHVERPA
jgi:hypothetical protein